MNSLITYNDFGDDVTAFVTRRTVGRNRQRICELLDIDDQHLIYPHQTHEDRILVIDESFINLEDEKKKDILEGIDAVITPLKDICIGVSTADCIPVLVYDQEHQVAAAIHAGWRGTVKRIVEKTIDKMVETFSSRPESLKAIIGPGITLKNFEVGDEVYDNFATEGFDMEKIAKRETKWHIDLHECNKLQLIKKGLQEANINVDATCTFDNTDILFSARVEQKGIEKCGRNFNGIIIR